MPPSDDEFKPVEYSKKPSKSRNKGKGKQRAADNGLEKSIETLLAQKHALLRESGYSQKCKDVFREAFPAASATSWLSQCKRCICLGLGSLKNHPNSLLQLALLQDILDMFKLDESLCLADPAFSDEDLAFLQSLGYRALREEHDLRTLTPTFLYMPHCPRSLYEQLLERNNDTLENILLLSNQLNLYAERELRSEVLKKIPYLQKLGPQITAMVLPEYEDWPEAFNDMAWQSWKSS